MNSSPKNSSSDSSTRSKSSCSSSSNKEPQNESFQVNDLSHRMKRLDVKVGQSGAVNSTMVLIGSKLENFKIPQPGEYFEVRVTMASNPKYFMVHPHDDAPKLHELMSELQTYCQNNKTVLSSSSIDVGEVYAAQHSDNNWYRATVENIFGGTMIHVRYCDYGDVTVVSCDKLKILPAQFRQLPRQAIRAKLHGML